jgi:hypothetical protein
LCREEVVYERTDDKVFSNVQANVRGNECPEEECENMRKKMRSQCPAFRPVNPLPGSSIRSSINVDIPWNEID